MKLKYSTKSLNFRTLTFSVLVVIFSIFFLGCKNEEEKKYKIGFSQCLGGHPLRTTMNNELKVQSSLNPEFELKIFEADGHLDKQISDINYMIDEDFDVIIISPLEQDTIVQYINRAKSKGIPVILLDRLINSQNYDAFVGADNIEIGRIAAKRILSSELNQINVIEIIGSDNSSPSIERSKGFKQIIETDSRVNHIKTVLPDEIESLRDEFENFNKKPIHYIFSFNDEIAYNTWLFARTFGIEDKIKFIGVDGLSTPEGGIQLVNENILDSSVLYPSGGIESIQIAAKIINNDEFSKNNKLETILITSSNADILKNQINKINLQLDIINNQTHVIKEQADAYFLKNLEFKVTKIIILLLVILSVYGFISFFTIKKKNRQLQKINEKINEQRVELSENAVKLKQANEAKVDFFTGISHEYKTPLTLILSAVESLKDSKDIRKLNASSEFSIIFNNANRLLMLINQLLDFRKIENNDFNLKVSKTNFNIFLKNITNDFAYEAKLRNINFNVSIEESDLEVYIDRNLFDKVFFNLLSNAFKFTSDNGFVKISYKVVNKHLFITIKDSGIGIPDEELKSIFDPFYIGSNNKLRSSGIGLYITSKIIKQHHGEIGVSSKNGTQFTLKLLLGSDHFKSNEIIIEDDLSVSSSIFNDGLIENSEIEEIELLEDNEKYTVLLIEDNLELISLMSKKLNKSFNIIKSNGTDAIELAIEQIPDLVICDINLVDKNGFQISKELKEDLRTSHIPIIILTALNNQTSMLKALESGVDLYLTKPFSFRVLLQSIKSLLYNREKLRFYFSNNIHKVDELEFGKPQQQFIVQLNKLIDDNIKNSNFGVEQIASSMSLSRSQLYRKVKALLGINISEYMMDRRLELSKEFLKDTSLNIAEVAFEVGFSTPNYFSTSFKIKYGISPKEFRDKNS